MVQFWLPICRAMSVVNRPLQYIIDVYICMYLCVLFYVLQGYGQLEKGTLCLPICCRRQWKQHMRMALGNPSLILISMAMHWLTSWFFGTIYLFYNCSYADLWMIICHSKHHHFHEDHTVSKTRRMYEVYWCLPLKGQSLVQWYIPLHWRQASLLVIPELENDLFAVVCSMFFAVLYFAADSYDLGNCAALMLFAVSPTQFLSWTYLICLYMPVIFAWSSFSLASSSFIKMAQAYRSRLPTYNLYNLPVNMPFSLLRLGWLVLSQISESSLIDPLVHQEKRI